MANEIPSNASFETWTGGDDVAPDDWTLYGIAAEVAKESTIVKVDTYSCKLTRVTGNNLSLYRTDVDDAKGINYWKSKKIVFSCWVYATVADRARLSLYDGVTRSYSDYQSGNSDWELLTLEVTINANATGIEISCVIDTGDTSAYFDGAVFKETEYTITVTVGEFTLTGITTALSRGWTMAVTVGTFTLTGIAALFTKALNITCSVGEFVLTGISAGLGRTYTMIVTVGEFTLTGIATIFTKALNIVVAVGEFTLTGIATTFTKALNIVVTVGQFTLSGVSVILNKGWAMTASVGEFVLTGITVNLLRPIINMVVSTGSFVLTGITSTLKLILKTIPKPIMRIITTNLSTRITSHKPIIRTKKDNPTIR